MKKRKTSIKRSREEKRLSLCPKCGKPSWTPQPHRLKSVNGLKEYLFLNFRHPDKRKKRRSRSCYVKQEIA